MKLKQMHRLWLILLFAWLLPFSTFATDQAAEGIFEKGNKAYEKAKYEEAIKSYQQLIDEGYVSSALYYNLGNSHYRLGELPAAVLYYEKARKLSPGDEDIKLNLQLANSKIKDKFEVIPEFFLAKWWNGLVLMYSQDTWSGIAVAGILMGSILLVIYLFAIDIKIKKSGFYAGIVIILLGLFGLLMAQLQQSYFDTHQEAIVFGGTVHVKAGPADAEKTLVVIHEGTKLGIKSRKGNWASVVLPNGNEGWVSLAELREI